MKSRLEDIIQDLDNCLKEDIKLSSQIFGLAAASVQKNQELLEQLQEKTNNSPAVQPSLPSADTPFITKESLQKQYGNYNAAYQFYHEQYGITCKKGWKYLIKAIQELSSPEKNSSLDERIDILENRVQQLEKMINVLVNIIKNFN